MDGAFVYILSCADKSYYTGLTRDDMELRLSQHQQGKFPGTYTFRRRPVALVWHSHLERFDEAIATERRIKRWTRAKKEALIRGDYDSLPGLAKKTNWRR